MKKALGLALVLAVGGCSSERRAATPVAVAPATTAAVATSSAQDAEGPEIRIYEPERGRMIPAGSRISVIGRVADSSGVREVTVDGRAAKLERDGTFAVEVDAERGAGRIEIVADDALGNRSKKTLAYLAGDFVPDNAQHAGAVVARLDRTLLGRLEGPVAAALGRADLGQELGKIDPLYRASGWWGSVTARSTAARISNPRVTLEPRAGSLAVGATLSDLRVDFRVHVKTGFGFDLDGHVSADRVDLATDATVSAGGGGSLRVDASPASVRFTGFRFELDHVPFVDSLLRSEVRSAVERALREEVGERARSSVDQALRSVLASQARRGPGGRVQTIALYPERVKHDARGIAIELASLVAAGPPSAVVAPSPGSLRSTGPGPALPLDRALAVGLSEGFFDQLLHAAWQSGALHAPLDGAAVSQLGISGVRLDSDGLASFFPRATLSRGAPARVLLDPLLPPVLELAPGRPPALVLGDVGITVLAGAGATPEPVVTGYAQVRIPAEVAPDGSSIRISLRPAQAEVTADVSAITIPGVGTVPHPSDAELERFARALLPGVLDGATSRLEGFALPEVGVAGSRPLVAGDVRVAPSEAGLVITGDYR